MLFSTSCLPGIFRFTKDMVTSFANSLVNIMDIISFLKCLPVQCIRFMNIFKTGLLVLILLCQKKYVALSRIYYLTQFYKLLNEAYLNKRTQDVLIKVFCFVLTLLYNLLSLYWRIITRIFFSVWLVTDEVCRKNKHFVCKNVS